MASQTHRNANQIDESEDWEVIPEPEAHEVDHVSGNNNYIYFQLNSWLGRMSYVARISAKARMTHVPDSIAQKLKGPIHQQQQSPLFRLPAELRLYIYELLFRIPTTDHGIKLRRSNGHDRPTSVLTSLLTCHRFKNEAEYMFYWINRIFMDDVQLLASLGAQRRDVLAMIAINAPSASSMLVTLQSLHQLPNLKSTHVVRTMSVQYIDPRSWAVMAPQIITEIKKMKSLEEIKFITPDAKDLTEHDIVRKRRLDEIDARICGALRSATARIGVEADPIT